MHAYQKGSSKLEFRNHWDNTLLNYRPANPPTNRCFPAFHLTRFCFPGSPVFHLTRFCFPTFHLTRFCFPAFHLTRFCFPGSPLFTLRDSTSTSNNSIDFWKTAGPSPAWLFCIRNTASSCASTHGSNGDQQRELHKNSEVW